MNRELRELLDKINSKKEEVKNLANENKIEEAKAAKKELIDLQAKFDVLYDLEEEAEDKMKNGDGKVINGDRNNKHLDKKLIRNAIYPGENIKFENSLDDIENNDLDLGKLIKVWQERDGKIVKKKELFFIIQ